MPLPLLALAAAPAVAKGLLGAFQLTQDVKRVDTTTPAEREALALTRQSAAARMPGLAQYQARLAQGQNAATQSAALGSGSGADFLAASAAADRQRQLGENQMGVQQDAYRDRSTQQLQRQLAAYAAHQQADTDRAAQGNSALKGAGLQNLSGALSDGATIAAYGAGGAAPGALGPSGYPAGDYPSNPYYRRRTSPYGGYMG